MIILCAFCDEPVVPNDRFTLQKVTGWEKKRRQGGANQIILREILPEYAHNVCVDDRRRGVVQGQGLIFEQETTH
ncbi:hypothetical protein LCGC14_1922440 [marine sediment metagenome]|uniref:Uncharacterized protein n=1 Tax=marine sediment metagenome TaxID=412755 RepID=A0A0F9FR40_9ZZZZ